MKIVINKSICGIGLSPIGLKEYLKRKGKKCYFYFLDMRELKKEKKCVLHKGIPEERSMNRTTIFYLTKDFGEVVDLRRCRNYVFHPMMIERNDKDLVSMVESLGQKVCLPYAHLKVVEIPDDVKWEIEDCNGVEIVCEKHRHWE